MKKKTVLITTVLILTLSNVFAQGFKSSKTQFMIRGYGHSGFNYLETEGEKESNFEGATFAPIFLFKHSDRLLFEAELAFELEDGEVKIDFEYANFNYKINKFLFLRAGKFLLPFGTFIERLHPAWINRLSTMPLGFGHDGIAPSSGIGVELTGAVPVGSGKVTYSLYATNGPSLKDGSDEPEEAGMLSFENFEDNNNNKAIGGRIGILPFSNSSTEIGFSAYSGKVGNREDPLYEDLGAFLYAIDFSFVKQMSSLKGILDIKAQYNNSKVDEANYFEEEDGVPIAYSFDNASNGYYAQLSYRPSMAENKVLKNFELVGRYSALTMPEGAEWEQEATQIAIGLNYWVSWRSVFKFNFQVTDSEGGHGSPAGKTSTTGIFAHWALGF